MNKTTIVENQSKDNTNGKPNKRIKEDRPRKKDDKSVDHVLRALDSLGTTEEKLGAMCQKYAEMFNDHRMLQSAVKQAERKNTLLQKEKEQLQAEHSKAILTRSRLENLCRELQRQNKAVKEECMLKMREEGEKKREVAAKFHSMLSEIGSLLAQNNDKNAKLRDDNLDMSMRLKSVCDQFEKKEQHVENLAKQMQLEMQLADAKLAKAKMEMDIEKETLQKEKQQLLIELSEYKRKLCEMKASELALREQITMYSEKYEEFHKALLQSNTAIGEFKAEMERMTKHIRRLEKETATWKTRYDAAQRTLAEVTQGKIRSDEALGLSQRRLIALQGICRGLQDQCRQLRGETRRDSQTDEDYKRLEAQIKEVERADSELNGTPSPTSATLNVEANNETESLSELNGTPSPTSATLSVEANNETESLSELNGTPSPTSATLNVEANNETESISELNGTPSPTSATLNVEANNETESLPTTNAVSSENETKPQPTTTTGTISLPESETESPVTTGTVESYENKESINKDKLSNEEYITGKKVFDEIKSDENIINKEKNETEKQNILEENKYERCLEISNDDKIDTEEKEDTPNEVPDTDQPSSVACDGPAGTRQETNTEVLLPHSLLALVNGTEETTLSPFSCFGDNEENLAIKAIINHLQEMSLLHEKADLELTNSETNLLIKNEEIPEKNERLDSENEKEVPSFLCMADVQNNGISSTMSEPAQLVVQAHASHSLTNGSDADCSSIPLNSGSTDKSPNNIEEISNVQQSNKTSNEQNPQSHQDDKIINITEEVNQTKNKRKRKNRK